LGVGGLYGVFVGIFVGVAYADGGVYHVVSAN
jgi:hypothetical protein